MVQDIGNFRRDLNNFSSFAEHRKPFRRFRRLFVSLIENFDKEL